MNRLFVLPLVVGVACCMTSNSQGQNLLLNGNLEIANTPPSWESIETVTDLPGRAVNSAAVEAFANQPGPQTNQQGIWLRSFAGNQNGIFNEFVNATLRQTVPLAPGATGQTYTFRGWTKFEPNYAGGVDLLDTTSTHDPTPMDAGDPATVDSPTETFFKLEFLDAGGSLIDGFGSTMNIRTDREAQSTILMIANDNIWRQHTLTAVAPATASSVRVSALATDMAYNCDCGMSGQSAFIDNFSLRASGSATTERLSNANFNQADVTPGWTRTNTPAASNVGELNEEGFANHTTDGLTGLWLKQFTGTGSIISQTVPATAGEEYLFSGYAKWEAKYSGGEPGTTTQTFMRIEFLDSSSVVIGDPNLTTLSLLADGQTRDGNWQLRDISAVAPENTASVRVTAGSSGMFLPANPEGLPQGAFFDDFSLTIAEPPGLDGDYNNDGVVDAADYVAWQKNPTAFEPNAYQTWQENFGETLGGGGSADHPAVPEPSGLIVALAIAVGGLVIRCRDLRAR